MDVRMDGWTDIEDGFIRWTWRSRPIYSRKEKHPNKIKELLQKENCNKIYYSNGLLATADQNQLRGA